MSISRQREHELADPGKRVKASWRLGRFSLFGWSVHIFLLIVLVFTAAGLFAAEPGLPLIVNDETYLGSYPLFWLVYVCVPLFFRDLFLFRANGQRLTAELKLGAITLVIVGLLAYRYVFGWI